MSIESAFRKIFGRSGGEQGPIQSPSSHTPGRAEAYLADRLVRTTQRGIPSLEAFVKPVKPLPPLSSDTHVRVVKTVFDGQQPKK